MGNGSAKIVRRALGVEVLNEIEPLTGVNAGRLGIKRAAFRKESAYPG